MVIGHEVLSHELFRSTSSCCRYFGRIKHVNHGICAQEGVG